MRRRAAPVGLITKDEVHMLKRKAFILGLSAFLTLASTAAEARPNGSFTDWLQSVLQHVQKYYGHGKPGGGFGHCR